MSLNNKVEPVVIVGGGLVGGLCALLLAKAGVQAIVLDAAAPLDDAILNQRDARVWALSAASIRLLTHVNVWQHIERKADYYGMQVWTRDGYGQLDFGQTQQDTFHADSEILGSIVEPSVLGLAIQQALNQQVKQYRTEVRVKKIEQLTNSWQITLSNDEQINTSLLIGADGGNSLVRQSAGIGIDELDYQQTAVTCAIKTEKPHQHIARQVFLPTGPLAFLPMTDLDDASCDNASVDSADVGATNVDAADATDVSQNQQQGHWQSVVWTMPEQDAEDIQNLNDADFLAAITQASGSMLGQVLAVQSRASFPLIAKQAERYVLPHLALIGDAAHVVHPLAGQGVNLGCLDAALLVDSLLLDHERGLWAHFQTLNRYETKRRTHNSVMMHSFSALGWLQRDRLRLLQWLRNEGLHIVANNKLFLDKFTEQASGKSALKDTRYAQY